MSGFFGSRRRVQPALHDGTPTAPFFLVIAIVVELLHAVLILACATGRAAVRGHFLVVSADFADNVVEGVVDVDAGLGRGLDEFAAELPREILAL